MNASVSQVMILHRALMNYFVTHLFLDKLPREKHLS